MIKAARNSILLNSAILISYVTTYVTLFPDSSELATIKGVCERVADVYAAIGVLSLHNGL